MKRIPCIIDTDIGNDIDDMIAIMYAIKSNVFDIKGIICSYGPTDKRLSILKDMLSTFKVDIPVFKGSSKPIVKNEKF